MGDQWIDALKKNPSRSGTKADYTVGEAEVHTYRFADESIYRFSVYVASRSGYYSVTTTSASENNATLAPIILSIRLNGVQVVKDFRGQVPTAAASFRASSLKSSEVISAALKRKQTEPIEIVHDSMSVPPHFAEKQFSRGVIIVRKPPARYSEEARNEGVSGTVRLRILFKANGNIGRITIQKGLSSGSNEQAIAAAREIKFVPAEVLGVPTDSELTFEYGFRVF
jgi:TonB family protein